MVKDKSVTRSQVSDFQASVCFTIPIWSGPKWTWRSLSPKNLQKHREKQRKRFRSTLSFSLWSRSYPQRSLQYSENFLKEPKLRQGSPHLSTFMVLGSVQVSQERLLIRPFAPRDMTHPLSGNQGKHIISSISFLNKIPTHKNLALTRLWVPWGQDQIPLEYCYNLST